MYIKQCSGVHTNIDLEVLSISFKHCWTKEKANKKETQCNRAAKWMVNHTNQEKVAVIKQGATVPRSLGEQEQRHES